MYIILTVFNISKIQNESNSQPSCACKDNSFHCVQYFKDTKWKQFTTLQKLYKTW